MGSFAHEIVKNRSVQAHRGSGLIVPGYVELGENYEPEHLYERIYFGLYPTLDKQERSAEGLRRLVRRFRADKGYRAPKGLPIAEGSIVGVRIAVAESEKLLRKYWTERLGLVPPKNFSRGWALMPQSAGDAAMVVKPTKYAGFRATPIYEDEDSGGDVITR